MRILLILTIAMCSLLGTARADNIDSMLMARQTMFDRFSIKYPRERVYLHFDNTSYYKGEQIWYKAYVVNDDDFRATDVSRILYVELLNPLGYPIETQKLKIEDGQARGAFLLNDTINAGFYEVQAYTQWMLNFASGDKHGWRRLHGRDIRFHYGPRFQHYLKGNASVFSRVFPVYEQVDSGQYHKKLIPQQAKATSQLVMSERDKLMIDFYPEGGNMVHGISTRVAFQAHNAAGRTLNVAGALVRRGDSIGYFKTDYAGRGVFHVTPEEVYDDELLADGLKLKLTYNGKNYTFKLPKSKRKGYVLNVFNNGNQVKTIVSRNDKTDGRKLGLSITCRGRSQYFDMLDLRQMRKAHVVLDKSSLTTGVNIVTLFDEDGKTLAQRMIFVDNGDMKGYNLQTRLDTAEVAPYDKVGVRFQLADADGKPVAEEQTFSVSVTDDNTRERTYDTGNILSGLLLSSEVKGFIPHPAYYFEADDAEHRNALDMLMMVQGWTRYDYDEMLGVGDFKPLFAVEKSLMFRGRLWRDRGFHSFGWWKHLKDSIWVYSELITDKGLILNGEVQVGKDGTFYFMLPGIYDKGKLSLTLNKHSAEEIGDAKAGVAGHLFSMLKRRRPKFLIDKHIEPLNQFSPLPKNYGYYETAALNDPWDENMFRKGFMAVPKNYNKFVYYDPLSQTYVINEVTKNKRRRWKDIRHTKPTAVLKVDEMMSWLSNIIGDMAEYHTPYSRNHDWYIDRQSYSWFNQMESESIRMSGQTGEFIRPDYSTSFSPVYRDNYIDISKNTNWYATSLSPSYRDNVPLAETYIRKTLEDSPHYYGLRELLYIFGLDGGNSTYYDGLSVDGTFLTYHTGVGDEKLLPKNVKFFPSDKNFTKMYLYADIDNRSQIYNGGLYGGNAGARDSLSLPSTSIFNFVSEQKYANNVAQPEYLGFRINFQGYTKPTEFYSPDYGNMPLPEQTDYRRTVYWNPDVRTDEKGQAEIEFYNNGFSKKLNVSAEGITAGGTTITTKQEQ